MHHQAKGVGVCILRSGISGRLVRAISTVLESMLVIGNSLGMAVVSQLVRSLIIAFKSVRVMDHPVVYAFTYFFDDAPPFNQSSHALPAIIL